MARHREGGEEILLPREADVPGTSAGIYHSCRSEIKSVEVGVELS